jgi:hypothetical protein
MISYFAISIFSALSIFSFSKFINLEDNFKYFFSIVCLTLITLFFLFIKKIEYIIILKILLILICFYRIYLKKICFNNFDKFFFFVFFFLIYYNFQDNFYKTDIIAGYGALTKFIFLRKILPFQTYNEYHSFSSPQVIDLSGPIFYNFFLSGLSYFREDLTILSHNIVLTSFLLILFKKTDFTKKKIIKISTITLIFFCLVNIFFQGGKSLFGEEISIVASSALTLFFFKNRSNLLNRKIVFLFFGLFFLFLSKSTSIIFIVPLILYSFFLCKNLKIKFLINFLIILLFLFTFIMKDLVNTKLFYNENIFKNNIINPYNTISDNQPKYKFDLERAYLKDAISGQRYFIRFNEFKNNPEFFTVFDVIINDIFDIEVYKASVLPPARFILNKFLKIDFPRISIKFSYWIIFITTVYLLLLYLNKKRLWVIKIIYINLFIFLFTSFLLTVLIAEDIFKSRELITINGSSYSYNLDFLSKNSRDTSRYLSWSIIFGFFILTYFLSTHKIYLKKKIFILILFFLLSVTPARAFGYIIKINKSSDNVVNSKKEILSLSKILNKKCNNNIIFLIYNDDDIKKFDLLKFVNMNLKYINIEYNEYLKIEYQISANCRIFTYNEEVAKILNNKNNKNLYKTRTFYLLLNETKKNIIF